MDLADLTELTQRRVLYEMCRVLYEMVWEADFSRDVYPRTTPSDFGMRADLAMVLATHDRTEAGPTSPDERAEAVVGRLQKAAVAAEDYRRQHLAWRAARSPRDLAPALPTHDEPRWLMVTAAARTWLRDGPGTSWHPWMTWPRSTSTTRSRTCKLSLRWVLLPLVSARGLH